MYSADPVEDNTYCLVQILLWITPTVQCRSCSERSGKQRFGDLHWTEGFIHRIDEGKD